MRLSAILLLVLVTTSALAQSPQQNWVPQAIESLGQNASSRTEFTLDHSMLVLAAKADQDDEGLRRVIAGVDGISVHRFRFQTAGMYDPGILNSVRQQYREWAEGQHRYAGMGDEEYAAAIARASAGEDGTPGGAR